MGASNVDIIGFLNITASQPLIDVRSEGEYRHAHIPGAVSLPLFNNEERKIIGTAYKQQSREKAIKIGLDLFGKKMVSMVEQVEALTASLSIPDQPESGESIAPDAGKKTVYLHCWRGGMRSASVAWLLDLYGFKVYTLAGGYKAFRNWVLQQFDKAYRFKILGGYTGSGKTFTLAQMKQSNAVVIDLEALAQHKGSAFGSFDMPSQPSQEMFENTLALALYRAASPAGDTDQAQTPVIWLEDESQRIGNLILPQGIWNMMRAAPVVFLDIPFEERINHVIAGYGDCPKDELINATLRIKKRLGGQETKIAINYLEANETKAAFSILLAYYDRLYNRGLEKRDPALNAITTITCNQVNAFENAQQILKQTDNE